MNNLYLKLLVFTFYFSFTLVRSNSQSGIIDLNFGNQGKVVTDFGQQFDQIGSVLFLKDSSFIQYGFSDKGALRYIAVTKNLKDGNLNLSFGNNGKILIRANISCLKIFETKDGKLQILALMKIGLTYNLILMRLNSDGSMDLNYSNDGIVIIENFIICENYYDCTINEIKDSPSQYFIVVDGCIKNTGEKIVRLIDCNTFEIKDLSFVSDFVFENYFVYQNSIYKSTLHKDLNYLRITKYNLNGDVNFDFGKNGSLDIFLPMNVVIIQSFSWREYSKSELALFVQCEEYIQQNIITKHFLMKFDTLGNLDKNFGNLGIVVVDSIVDGTISQYISSFMTLDGGKFVFSISKLNSQKVFSELKRFDKDGKLDESFFLKSRYPTNYHLGDSLLFFPEYVEIVEGKLYIGSSIKNDEKSMDFFLARFNLNPVPTLIKSENFSRKLFIVNNPITEDLIIRFKDEVLDEDSHLQIVDMNANILHTMIIKAVDFSGELKVNLDFIPSGQYIVCLRNSKGSYHNKFIKL